MGGARNQLVDLERLSNDELKKLEKEFRRIGKKAEVTADRVDSVREDAEV